MKAKSLQDLSAIAQALAQQRIKQEQQDAERQRQQQRAQAAQDLFAQTVGPVRALHHRQVADLAPPPAEPLARMHQRDEQAVLRESLSDGVDVGSLLETDEQLSYHRPGVGPDVLRKLRNGHWTIQRQIDLHGLRTDEARKALGDFLRQAQRDALRCLRVIHGKGHGSPGKAPILKPRVPAWLAQRQEVMAFVQASPADGGGGALLVLLNAAKPGSRPISGPFK